MSSKAVRRVRALDAQYINHLEQRGFHKCEDVLVASELELMQRLDLSLFTVRYIYFEVAKQVAPKPQTVFDTFRKKNTFLATGIQQLDAALKGGVQCGKVTEIVGAPTSGKSHFCLALMLQSLFSYPGSAVLLFDTALAFEPEKIVGMAQAQGLHKEQELNTLLRRMTVMKTASIVDLSERIHGNEIQDLLIKQNVKLIVLDTIANVRNEFGHKDIPKRQELLSKLSSKLKDLAEQLSIPIVVTNSIVKADNDEAAAALGWVWAHCVNTRLTIRHCLQSEHQRELIITKSPIAPIEIIKCEITDAGLISKQEQPEQANEGILRDLVEPMSQLDTIDNEEHVDQEQAVSNKRELRDEVADAENTPKRVKYAFPEDDVLATLDFDQIELEHKRNQQQQNANEDH